MMMMMVCPFFSLSFSLSSHLVFKQRKQEKQKTRSNVHTLWMVRAGSAHNFSTIKVKWSFKTIKKENWSDVNKTCVCTSLKSCSAPHVHHTQFGWIQCIYTLLRTYILLFLTCTVPKQWCHDLKITQCQIHFYDSAARICTTFVPIQTTDWSREIGDFLPVTSFKINEFPTISQS